jgi:dynactin complex subunit
MGISDKRPRTAPSTKPQDLAVGARVCVLLNGQRCLGSLQYFGNLDKYDHMWCGIELDRPCKLD